MPHMFQIKRFEPRSAVNDMNSPPAGDRIEGAENDQPAAPGVPEWASGAVFGALWRL